MKKVIPKKKDAFAIISIESGEMDSSNFSRIQSPSFAFNPNPFNVEATIGVAGENINTGDLVMVRMEDGLITRFTGPEGKKNV